MPEIILKSVIGYGEKKNYNKCLNTLFRKSDEFFGLRSEKVATILDYVPKKFGVYTRIVENELKIF